MVIYLVRHTTPDVEKGVCYGQADLKVTETFEEEAGEVKTRLRDLGAKDEALFFSSPLQRCHQLAAFLTDSRITTDKRLMEMDFGEWEMQKWNDIDEVALRCWTDDFVHEACPGGESYQTFYARVVGFLKVLKGSDAAEAVIVTHGGVIRSVLSYLGETTLETSFEVVVNYGAIFRVEI